MAEMTPERAREIEQQLANAFGPKPTPANPPLHTVMPVPTQVPTPSPYDAFDTMRKKQGQ